MVVSPLTAQETGLPRQSQHYTYIDGENKISDLFYNNITYYQCKTKRHCKPNTDGTPSRKKLAIFLLDRQSGIVVPSFIQCHEDGNSTASMAENLIPLVNKALNKDPCVNVSNYKGSVPRRFVEDALQVIDNYDDNGCPKEDRSCARQIFDLFEQDLKNTFSLFSSKKTEDTKTDMGCLTTVLANVKEAIMSTLKLVFQDIPRGIWNAGKSLWNYVMDTEGESSTAMLLASVMSEEMATALSSGDIASFYTLLRKNFFSLLGNIREFYSELLGCTQWSGEPYNSECLKKTNWSCPTCESITNFQCGLIGQIGAGYFMGGILGTVKGIQSLAQMRKNIANNPSRFGIAPDAVKQITDKKFIQDAKDMAQKTSYQVGQYIQPVTTFLETGTNEMKTLFALGNNFRSFVAMNPVTTPYHITFQAGQARAFNAVAQTKRKVPGISSNSTLVLSRKYGQGLNNIRHSFDEKLKGLYRIRGNQFNQSVYDDITKRYFADVQKEMTQLGVQVTPVPGGLRLAKGGETFDYTPDLKARVEAVGRGASMDDFTRIITNGDHLIDRLTPDSLKAPGPNFISDIHRKADLAKSSYAVKSGASDGYMYLAHFTAQTQDIVATEKCDDLLYEMEVVTIHDVTPQVTPVTGK